MARTIPNERDRAQALAGLAPHLPAPLLQEALEMARTIPDDEIRAEALAGLAPHLSAPLQEIALQEAFEATRAIPFGEIRAAALAALAPSVKQLSVVRLYSLWSQSLHILANGTRFRPPY